MLRRLFGIVCLGVLLVGAVATTSDEVFPGLPCSVALVQSFLAAQGRSQAQTLEPPPPSKSVEMLNSRHVLSASSLATPLCSAS